MTDARPSAPPRVDPIAAALAFAVREAVRLETESAALNEAPGRANVSGMDDHPESTGEPEALVA